MTYKLDRDKAAVEWDENIKKSKNIVVEEAFKAGADWALKSEVVRKLVDAVEWYQRNYFGDNSENEVNRKFRVALEAYAQALKESEK